MLATVPQLMLALMIANLLNRQLRARTAFRMGVLLRTSPRWPRSAMVFGFIFADALRPRQLRCWTWSGSTRSPGATTSWPSWVAVSTMVDWRWTGYNALIYLAAMQAIPKDLYESAAIDGAGRWRQFWQITVPLIRPTILFTVIISTIGGMQLFTEPLLFNYGRIHGGSADEFQTVAMYIYEHDLRRQLRVGYGAAIVLAAVPDHHHLRADQLPAGPPLGRGESIDATTTLPRPGDTVAGDPRAPRAAGRRARLWEASPLTYLALIFAMRAVDLPDRRGRSSWRRGTTARSTTMPPPFTPGGDVLSTTSTGC